MKLWDKKDISKEVVYDIHNRFNCDMLKASILARRGITSGPDILYFLESDERYLHSPFLFNTMNKAVERILSAKEEGEKVLVFGDRDVDGITSTTLLYQHLIKMGIDAQWSLPKGDDSYGLNTRTIESFAKEYGTLIITVDCGISNNKEVTKAAELGIDVIITDHHNPPENLPEPAIILNPKMPDSNYPFKDISGCAVAYKLVKALRIAETEIYKQEICLLNIRPANEAYTLDAIKIANGCEKERITESIIPGVISIEKTRLLPFLQGQQILVWDESLVKKQLKKAFGNSIEFNMLDIRPEITKTIPQLTDISLLRLSSKSRIAQYGICEQSEIDAFFNIFVTFLHKKIEQEDTDHQDILDLQLVALAAIADIMPLKNENRIFVKKGLDSINKGNARNGLQELLARQNMIGKKIGSTDLSWNIIPILNATGRLGQPELGVQLLTEEDPKKRDILATAIWDLNKKRKELGSYAWDIANEKAFEQGNKEQSNIIVIADERIHRGVTGIVASRLVKAYKLPSIVITFLEDGSGVGSVRSTRGFAVTDMLDSMEDLFLNHGGHNFAAGFSFKKENFKEVIERFNNYAPMIELSENADDDFVNIDAELPHSFITPGLLDLVDSLEPYGESNKPLIFMAKNVRISAADIMGKTEKLHLKLTLSFGGTKWPALFWNEGERLGKDFNVGDKIDIVFQINRNYYNGNVTPQLILIDCIKSINL